MAASLNKVLLMGNLTRDPEIRYIPSGTAVASFTLASNRVYASQTGEKKEEVTFIRIVVWGRRAEVCGEYLSKGSSVFVEGRLKTRSWQTPDGQNRSTIEVVANNVQFLSTRQNARPMQHTAQSASPPPEELDSIDLGHEIPLEESSKESSGSLENGEVPF